MSPIRHFKALLKKNIIVWKRNVCCSLCELMCPVFLMFIIVLIRIKIEPSPTTPDLSLQNRQNPFYSPFNLDATGNWVLDQASINSLNANLNGFMGANNYTIGYPGDKINPVGPYSA